MKRILLIPVFFLISFANAQMQDLAGLAEGRMVYSTILSNSNGDLFGYMFFFDQGNTDEKTKQFEYVFLDKNLNKVSNGNYTEVAYPGLGDYFYDCTYMGNDIVISKFYGSNIMGNIFPALTFIRTISLDTSQVSQEFIYKNGEFEKLGFKNADEIKQYYKEHELKYIIHGINIQDFNGFFVTEDRKYSFMEKELKAFDADKKLKWSHAYNENGDKKNYKTFKVFDVNEGLITAGQANVVKGKADVYNLVSLDMKTGQKLFTYKLEDSDSEFTHTINISHYGDKIYIAGNYGPYSKYGFNWEKNLGVYRIILDKSGNELSKKYYTWKEIASDLKANKYGNVEKGYYLYPKRFFIFKDGSFSLLTEKFKNNTNVFIGVNVPKATDMVLFNFNSEGDFKGNVLLEKEYSSWVINDYLFHQYINDDTGVVFFFRDYKKHQESRDKNWVLGINTILNGEFKQETIALPPDDLDIQVMPAKEGYILLQEIKDKDKFNQIRLEKLNY